MKSIDINQKTVPLKHFWSTCVGAGRANEGLRADFQNHLRLVHNASGFKYLRFHGLLHDDMFLLRINKDGKKVYNFQYIDSLFDFILSIGMRPFVEFGFMPEAIKSGDETQFWWKGNITPPRCIDEWSELVSKLLNHWLDRYGLDEIQQWYFEVWNEPNLSGFWTGNKSQYFALYAATAKVVKSIDKKLRVGGPATSNFVPDSRFDGEVIDPLKQIVTSAVNLDTLDWHGVWIEDFLNYCEKNNLPVDFVSTHPYPTDFPLADSEDIKGYTRNIQAARDDLTWVHNAVKNSAYPDAEIHLTEWSSSPSPRDCTHDFLQEATFIIKTNLDCIGLVDSLSYWTFTDVFEESGAGDSIFHGGFGMINFQGIVKPSFHAYKMLNALGEELICKDEHAVYTKCKGKLSLLIHNYIGDKSIPMSTFPERLTAWKTVNSGNDLVYEAQLYGFKPKTKFILETLDKEHGWALPEWKNMGSPEPPTREQTEYLKSKAFTTKKVIVSANENGCYSLKLNLSPWSVCLIKEI